MDRDSEKARKSQHDVAETALVGEVEESQTAEYLTDGSLPKAEHDFRHQQRSKTDDAYDDEREERQKKHIVKSGETLSAIADDHGVSLKSVIAANPQIHNPNLIHPGQVIKLPKHASMPKPKAKVQHGDHAKENEVVVGGEIIVG
jgi:nucleoid-associated protein YgaU